MDDRLSRWAPSVTGLLVLASVAAICAAGPGASQAINRRGALTPGEAVSTLHGYGLDNRPVVVDYAQQGRPTVVYVIEERGGYFVKQNEPNFAALLTQAQGRFTFVVLCPVDTGALRDYLATAQPAWKGAPVTIVANVSEDQRQEMCLFMYPQTLVISTAGRVIRNFQGAYTKASSNAQPEVIEAFFGIKLPAGQRP
jgi:hypothetical protein